MCFQRTGTPRIDGYLAPAVLGDAFERSASTVWASFAKAAPRERNRDSARRSKARSEIQSSFDVNLDGILRRACFYIVVEVAGVESASSLV